MENVHHQQLRKIFGLSEHRYSQLVDQSENIVFKRNTIIKSPKRIFDRLYCITEGAVRTYYINEKEEDITYLLQVKGDFFGDYESYITEKPSKFIIETVVDTQVICIYKEVIDQLSEQDIFWMQFSKKIADMAFLDAKRRINELLFYSPEKRYLNLVQKNPAIIHNIPQKYISTYLGVTPQSLSRIRKRLTNYHK